MTATPADAFARLSPAMQYQVVNGLGWSELRPVQQLSTHAILDGANCVILAPTAGGKTEAAFFPLLSQMDREDWAPVSVLYIAPIRALLNNQDSRLHKLTALVGRTSGKWHGDVNASVRKKMIESPPDVLAITPESLEAMLLSTKVPARRLLGKVRAVVIDEVHAFAGDDRGAHLVALLERISRIAEGDIQRIGLSATVGDPETILEWLSGSSLRPQRIVNPGGTKTPPLISVDFVGSLDNAAMMVDQLYPGTRRLVFVDSRRRVEELGHKLSARGVNVYLSHSSLALSERAAAEKAFEEGTNCVIVATSALELGIDVGDLDHVIQIDAPGTVSSCLQRMGRTGRRAGTRANCTFLATDEAALLQAVALVELLEQGFVEATEPSSWAPHVLAHQAIALAMQEQGVAVHDWWKWLEGCAALRDISTEQRDAVIRHMLAENILVETDNRLVLGAHGEKLYGARNFLELYAVFSTPQSIRVMHGQQEVGVVDAFFLQERDRKSPSFVLGGRPWRIIAVDWKGATCAVEPGAAGAYPSWFGQPIMLSRALCQSMRKILVDDQPRPTWSKRTVAAIEVQRAAHEFLRSAEAPVVDEANGKVKWWTFAGGRGNRVLASLLEASLGSRVIASNTAITFADGAAKSTIGIRDAIVKVGDNLTWEKVAPFADVGARARVSKFQPCLPPGIELELVAREVMSLFDAKEVVVPRDSKPTGAPPQR